MTRLANTRCPSGGHIDSLYLPASITWRCLILLLTIHTALLCYGAWCHSPAYDEVAHLPAGLSIIQLGQFRLYAANPPIVRIIAAIPVAILDPATDWRRARDTRTSRPEFDVGRSFIRANGKRAFRLYFLARLACIPLSILGAVVCFLWARSLFSSRAGLVAATLWCFSPIVLAGGQMITPDMGAASLGALALYVFRNWCWNRTAALAFWSGVSLGLAECSKFTWLIAVAIYPTMWALAIASTGDKPRLTRIAKDLTQLVGILLVALTTINLVYCFQGTCRRLDSFHFASQSLGGKETVSALGNRFAGSWIGMLPIPLPEDYVLGFDTLKCDFEYGSISYLRGNFRAGGWWYYFFYAALVKMPLGVIALGVLGSVLLVCRHHHHHRLPDILMLLIPIALILIASTATPMNRHFRYMLVTIPFAYILLSGAATLCRQRWVTTAVVGCITWTITSSLWIYPHSLSYFNEIVGGPRGGASHLIDSNIDWGQDYPYLRDWIEKHPFRNTHVQFFGCFQPEDVTDDFKSPPLGPTHPTTTATHDLGPQPGWYAVSTMHLKGAWLFDLSDRKNPRMLDFGYTYFENFEPTDRIGYSINVYNLKLNEVQKVRQMLGLLPLSIGDP